jgi:membrane protein DedA with SNARE-associated domain
MKTAFAWIHQYGYLTVFLLVMFGEYRLPLPDKTLLLFVG